MKAFVIKNKEGKYLSFSPIEFNKDIRDAVIFKNADLSQYCPDPSVILKDAKFVAITICEGDLDHKIAVLERALELACEEVDNYWNCKKANQKNQTLEQYFIQQAKESEDE